MEHFAIPGTIRASFSIYNTLDEVDLFAELMIKASHSGLAV